MSKFTDPPKIVPIMVAHNSEKYIEKFWDTNISELACKVYIVNSSTNKISVDLDSEFVILEAGDNVGFSAANNLGINQNLNSEPDYFLIINPDVLLPSNWLSTIEGVLTDPRYSDAGIFTVPLLDYQFEEQRASGCIDSLGIEHTWYGRWYDVSRGLNVSLLQRDDNPYEISAACGALMLIRKSTVLRLLENDGYVFNVAYFMYKEDIELSIRVRPLGDKIMMVPSAPAYHCRGWANERADSPYWARELSARNELKMHLGFFWRYVPYSAIKYLYVKTVERLLY